METMLSAGDVLESVAQHAETLNLEDAFKNTPINSNNKNSFGAERTTKGKEEGNKDKSNKQTTKTKKPRANQSLMSSVHESDATFRRKNHNGPPKDDKDV